VVGADGVAFEQVDEPARRRAGVGVDDAVAQRRVGETRGGGDAGERRDRIGEPTQSFDAGRGE
jgi:hypothetical protein